MAREIRATYRVQLHAGCGFEAAAAIAEYLAALGISHLYSSPYLQAGRGSMHGYDVVNPHRINEELGGAEAHTRFCEALGCYGLGQVLDIVPNHMAIAGSENPWWWDVLENGPASRYAAYFDVDWDPPESRLRYSILLPVLGDHYGRVLETGELWLERRDGTFTIRYHDHAFPVSPRTLDVLLGSAAERCQFDELAFAADAFGQLPLSTATDWTSVRRRHRDKEVLGAQLARLLAKRPEVAEAVDAVVAELNANHDALHMLLERQNYRLAFWRAAARDLGYRRFFDINTLVALRMEDEQVFSDTHTLVLRWLSEGMLDGVRIDHPDGLRDPEAYCQRLHRAAPQSWIVVEKILEPGERLRDSWPVAGTTGYDFLNRVGGLFVDPAGERPLTDLYAEFTSESIDYPALVRAKKHQVLHELLGEEAVHGFVTDVLADPEFTADLAAFVTPLVQPGRMNALAQTLLKLTAPGVPDLYQGTEVWNLSLVDPDNHRPVDYDLRRRLLRELEGATPEQMWAWVDEGMPKLWLIRQALALRRRQPKLFGPQGDYQPLLAKGERAAHVVAFARGSRVVTVVPRLVLKLNGEWGNTTFKVPDGAWRNELTGDDVDGNVTRMADLLARFPVALLIRKEGV